MHSVCRSFDIFVLAAVRCLINRLAHCGSVFQFLNVPMFRNVTLKCLTEIAGVSVNQYEEQFVNLFTLTMCQLKQVRHHSEWCLT